MSTAITIQTILYQDLCWTKWQAVHLVENKWYVKLSAIVLTSRDILAAHLVLNRRCVKNVRYVVSIFCVQLAVDGNWRHYLPWNETLIHSNSIWLPYCHKIKLRLSKHWYHMTVVMYCIVLYCLILYYLTLSYILLRCLTFCYIVHITLSYIVIYWQRSTNRSGTMSYAGSQVSAVHWPNIICTSFYIYNMQKQKKVKYEL